MFFMGKGPRGVWAVKLSSSAAQPLESSSLRSQACVLRMASVPGGRGPKDTCFWTCTKARAASKPPVFSGGNGASSGANAAGADGAAAEEDGAGGVAAAFFSAEVPAQEATPKLSKSMGRNTRQEPGPFITSITKTFLIAMISLPQRFAGTDRNVGPTYAAPRASSSARLRLPRTTSAETPIPIK